MTEPTAKKREGFYRRDPGDALAGMVGLSLEERGVYNTVIDLLYFSWRPLEDNRAYIAAHCGCAVQKLNPILARLIAKGKLVTFEEGGSVYVSNRRFEDERLAIRGAPKTRSGRREVGEKSAGVGKKSPLLDIENGENQSVTPLDKTREDKKPPNPQMGDWDLIEDEQQSVIRPKPDKPDRKQKVRSEIYPEAFEDLWKAYPHVKGRSSKPKALAEWEKRPEDLRAKLPSAASRFAKEGREPNMDCGAKALERWLRDRNYDDWLDAAPSGAKPGERRYRFPNEEIRAAVVMELGEDWVSRRLDYCEWQEVPTRAILANNDFMRDEILRERDVFKRLRIDSVKLSPRAVA